MPAAEKNSLVNNQLVVNSSRHLAGRQSRVPFGRCLA
jgi:hypothetical protein